MDKIDPRLATIAQGLIARLETEASLGAGYMPLRLLPAEAVLPADALAHLATDPAGATVTVESASSAGSSVARSVADKPPPARHEPTPAPAELETPTRPADAPVAQTQPHQHGSEERLAALGDSVIEALACTKCRLCKGRKQVVFGEGNLDTDLVFVGDAPGREEDLQGRPFVGPVGNLLSGIIEGAFKRPRDSVYICNILKCRPPGNREPKADESSACLPYLRKQLEVIQPKAIVAAGAIAANLLTGQNLSADKLRGQWFDFQGIPLMPIYHTSFLLRQRRHFGRGNEYDKLTWQDLQKVIRRLEG